MTTSGDFPMLNVDPEKVRVRMSGKLLLSLAVALLTAGGTYAHALMTMNAQGEAIAALEKKQATIWVRLHDLETKGR